MREIVADQATDVVSQRKCHDQQHANDRGDQPAETGQHSLVGDVADVAVEKEGDDFHRAAWDAEDETLLLGVTEPFDLVQIYTVSTSY